MSDQLRDIVGRMVAAGESEADIAAVIQQLSRQEAPAPSSTTPTLDRVESELRDAGYGSLVEGMHGGVGMGGLVKAGEKTLGLGQRVAQRIYTGLLKPKQAIKDSFGGSAAIAETALNERVPISQGGLNRVTGRLGRSRDAALNTVREAEAQGVQGVTPNQVIGGFKPVVKELRNRADIGQPSELPRVGQRGRAIMRTAGRTGGQIPLTRAQQLKETAQDAASGAYRTIERGTQKQLSADDLMDTAVAGGLRSGIEQQVPAVAGHNARTQSLLGVKRAMEDALEREGNTLGVGGAKDALALATGGGAFAAGAGPMAIPIAVGTRMMTTPATGSSMAILLNEASRSGILDAATRAAMIRMMQDQQ